jgi:hypothetical protein
MKHLYVLLVFLIGILTPLHAKAYQTIWGQLLQRHVIQTQTKGITTTVVDYDQVGQSPSFIALIRYMEQTEVPAQKDEAFAFWLDVYHMALIKAFTVYPTMQNPDFYTTGLIRVAGIPMSLTEIQKQLNTFTETPLALVLTDGTLGSPDFPKNTSQGTAIDVYCRQRVQEMLTNSSKGIKIEPNTQMIYASQRVVDALGDNWIAHPEVKIALQDINPQSYSIKILPYDKTPNRRYP